MTPALTIPVLRTLADFKELPVGTRIATNTNKLLVLEESPGLRGYKARFYWYEEGELLPYTPSRTWLPAFVLPPVVTVQVPYED